MGWLVLFHVAVASVALALRARLGNRAFLLGALGPLAVVAWAAVRGPEIVGGAAHAERIEWVPALDLVLDFRVDAYALLFLLVVGVAGTAIFLYSARYFGTGARVGTFAATMTLFGGAMVGLVGSDHLLALFLFWELTTITSYLLIGYDDTRPEARSAALHAALVTASGGLAMLGGLVLLGAESGSYLISDILANPPAPSGTVDLAWVLVLLGAVTKSAQFPFHGWLPGAMAAPTPASAFLHSATMVKAGIFLVGRLAPAAVATTSWWRTAVLVLGFTTMVLGGWRALRQHDLKLLLAFGTVSQLGFMFLLIGSGDPVLLFGGLALLAAHALFKAALFMVVGTIDHEARTRDLRRLSGLRRSMPLVFWTALAAGASMAAVPLTFGFAAKEPAFDGLLHESVWLIALAAGASVLTVAYTGRFLVGAFGRHREGHEPAGTDAHTPRDALAWSPLALAAASIALGIAPGLVKPLLTGATEAVQVLEETVKLVAWPGFVPALGWSMATLATGAFLVWRSRLVETATGRVGAVAARLPTADGAFGRSVSGILTFADRSTGLIQNGSLPSYVGVIATVAVLVPSTALLGGIPERALPRTGSSLELVLGALVIGSAVGVAFISRRFAAVILLGGVGYGIAGLYAVIGGPDLALTQLLVETLALALFALVLRRLPSLFRRTRTPRTPRIVVSVLVAAFVFVGGLLTAGTQVDEPVSEYFVEESVPTAQGRNVVNVILVDFRGFDTLGEITVLAMAALGTGGLVLPIIRRRKESTE